MIELKDKLKKKIKKKTPLLFFLLKKINKSISYRDSMVKKFRGKLSFQKFSVMF